MPQIYFFYFFVDIYLKQIKKIQLLHTGIRLIFIHSLKVKPVVNQGKKYHGEVRKLSKALDMSATF